MQFQIYVDILAAAQQKCLDTNQSLDQYCNLLISKDKSNLLNYTVDKTIEEQQSHYLNKGFNLIKTRKILISISAEDYFKEIKDPSYQLQLLMMKDLSIKCLCLWFMSCLDKNSYVLLKNSWLS